MSAERPIRRESPSAKMRRVVPFFILAALGLGLLILPRAQSRLASMMQARTENAADVAGDNAREPPDIRAGAVAATMVGFFLFVVVAAIGLFTFYQWRAHGASFVKIETFVAPRLQILADGLPEPEIARQKADLGRSRWLEADHRIFQISIDEAMRLVAARGAKAYDPVPRELDNDPQRGPAP
jgi:hypothetical protein